MSSVEVGGGTQLGGTEGDWSSGMIPALGAGGREFDSRITPFAVFILHPTLHALKTKNIRATGFEPVT